VSIGCGCCFSCALVDITPCASWLILAKILVRKLSTICLFVRAGSCFSCSVHASSLIWSTSAVTLRKTLANIGGLIWDTLCWSDRYRGTVRCSISTIGNICTISLGIIANSSTCPSTVANCSCVNCRASSLGG